MKIIMNKDSNEKESGKKKKKEKSIANPMDPVVKFITLKMYCPFFSSKREETEKGNPF